MIHATRNAVHPAKKIPFIPTINVIPNPFCVNGSAWGEVTNSSKSVTSTNKTDVKITDVHMMNLLSFLRNGSAKKKSPIGKMKNCTPPHEVRPKASKIPAPTIQSTTTI